MSDKVIKPQRKGPPSAGLMLLLKPYKGLVAALVTLTIVANALNLVVPKLISRAIDSYTRGNFVRNTVIAEFVIVGLLVFVLTYGQNMVQTWAAERVAKDLRT